jgi:hypothetical protein
VLIDANHEADAAITHSRESCKEDGTMARCERAPRHVVAARCADNYQAGLQFNDGRKGLVDLADELYGAIFEPLRDRERCPQL